MVDGGACELPDDVRELPITVERCVTAALRGFVVGAGIKGGLALFGALARHARRGRGGRAAASPALQLREVWRYGLFLGTFAGGYCVLDDAIAAVWGRARWVRAPHSPAAMGNQSVTLRWRSIAAGALAGHALVLTGRGQRHTSLALYIFVRAAVLAVRCAAKSRAVGWLVRPIATWQYGDVLLMCASSAQIL
eukprot:SM004090S15639  [mRNA]  locus=s4090:104:1279:+ [translate_table: standard]